MKGITDKMKDSLENAGFIVKMLQNGIEISKEQNVLEMFYWNKKLVVRKNGKNENYDELKGVWARKGSIGLNLREGNKFFCIKI